MEDFISFFDGLKDKKEIYLAVILCVIMIANVLDWCFGWLNARLNKKVTFKSNIALYGIIKKMMYFLTLVLFMFVAFLLVPSSIAFPSVLALFTGYLLSELNSILSHLGLTDDGKDGSLFIDFLKTITERGSLK